MYRQIAENKLCFQLTSPSEFELNTFIIPDCDEYINIKNTSIEKYANIENLDIGNNILTGAKTKLKNHPVEKLYVSFFLSAQTTKLNTFNTSILYIIIFICIYYNIFSF